MIQGWGLFLWICWFSVLPGLAQIYRWTDDHGRVHYTDNPATIPSPRRAASHLLAPLEKDQVASPSASSQPPRPLAPTSAAPGRDDTAAASPVEQRLWLVEQQIATALQDRQRLLDRLKTVREIRTNPAFGQARRHIDETGRALAAIELQLDALYTELRQAQATQPVRAPDDAPAASPRATQGALLDTPGHDQPYWQQRATALRVRLQQVREHRQAILTQLASPAEEREAFGRRGREVLQLVQALERVTQELRAAETAVHALQQEANQAGVPAAWLQ